jgi:hypothetical protein
MNEPRALRRRPPREPGPRLLPVLLVLIVAGVAFGVGGKLLLHFFHHLAQPVRPLAAPTPTPTPNYAGVAPLQPRKELPTRLPPIPTPKGTWSLQASILPSSRATPVRMLPSVKPLPRTPVPRTPLPRTSTSWGETVPEASIPSAPRLSPGERVPVTRSHLSGPSRVVRRYLTALIRGDETTAYRMLVAFPGDPHASLTEESFINTSARISALSSAPEGAGAVARAEIETAGGLYFATYHLRRLNGRYLITSHEFIKL